MVPGKRNLLVKLLKLSRQEWQDLLHAQRAVLGAQLSLWVKSRGSLVSAVPQSAAPGQHGTVDPAIEQLAWAVDRVASFGPIRAQCLARSIALVRLLEARGHHGATVRVGVARIGERMAAHAWVEYGGVIISDPEHHILPFDELPGVDVDA